MNCRIRNRLVTGAAYIFLGIGIAGIFLPLLPTTPFILLAAFCFLRSSRARYEWLFNHRIFGGYISDYIQNRSMPVRAKIASILVMWTTMTVSALLVSKFVVSLLLALVGIGVTIHILSLGTPRASNGRIAPVDDRTRV